MHKRAPIVGGAEAVTHFETWPIEEREEHSIDSLAPCWCNPERRCCECNAVAPCVHGARRVEVWIHREAS